LDLCKVLKERLHPNASNSNRLATIPTWQTDRQIGQTTVDSTGRTVLQTVAPKSQKFRDVNPTSTNTRRTQPVIPVSNIEFPAW